jgi:hypothetical protein
MIQIQVVPEIPVSKLEDFSEDSANHSGLNYAYKAGVVSGLLITNGSVLLPASSTSYVEVDNLGIVSSNTSNFSNSKIPLALVVTGGSAITSVSNRRSWL